MDGAIVEQELEYAFVFVCLWVWLKPCAWMKSGSELFAVLCTVSLAFSSFSNMECSQIMSEFVEHHADPYWKGRSGLKPQPSEFHAPLCSQKTYCPKEMGKQTNLVLTICYHPLPPSLGDFYYQRQILLKSGQSAPVTS